MLLMGAVDARRVTRVALRRWLATHRLALRRHAPGGDLPGSYWGAPEAGVTGLALHVSDVTPLHSLLHEACHIVCAQADGRNPFERDAGGDDVEEAAVCALQLGVACALPGVGWRRLARDMDAWGYTFRAGSTVAWWCRDAHDARHWLRERRLATNLPAAAPRVERVVRPALPSSSRADFCTAAAHSITITGWIHPTQRKFHAQRRSDH